MSFEVEQKYPLEKLELVRPRLLEMGATFHEPIGQADQYFSHPSRNFAETDEALRLRQVGPQNYVTYKGPRLDTATKTRRELEFAIRSGADAAAEFSELLGLLGFRPVCVVRKHREPGLVRWGNHDFQIALDRVERLAPMAIPAAKVASEVPAMSARKSNRHQP